MFFVVFPKHFKDIYVLKRIIKDFFGTTWGHTILVRSIEICRWCTLWPTCLLCLQLRTCQGKSVTSTFTDLVEISPNRLDSIMG